jgi:AraC-like DNA-binding protein
MVVERNVPHFSTPFHFHPECELVYILEGNGKRIVGDSVAPFSAGDVIFLGSNVPHVWYSDKTYYAKGSPLHSRAIVIYFNKDIFGQNFYLLNETQCLKKLFHRAERGMQVTGEAAERMGRLMEQMIKKKSLDRITTLLQILQLLANTRDYEQLASIGYQHSYASKDNHKIDEVFRYVSQHFSRQITLEEIAGFCNLTPQSFCRFFKKRTQKTFIDFVNEFRISHATKLMAEKEDLSISEIAYGCGFNNISYFIKAFKVSTGVTPKQYRNKIEF